LLDANCDGYLDLFVLSDRSPNLLYLNTDSGFVEHGLYAGLAVTPSGEDPAWIHALPFDNAMDGCTDLIFLDRDANITVMLNDGRGLFYAGHFQTGIFRPRFPFRATTAIEADVDFDGSPDLILSDGRDTPVRIAAPDTIAADSSATQEKRHEEVLTESVMRILRSEKDDPYRPVEISHNMVLDTVLLVPRRAATAITDTAIDFITGELLGPEDLSPSSYEDLLRDPLFDLQVGRDLTTDLQSNAMLPDDSVLSIDSLEFIRPEREEYIEMDTLRVRQGPKSMVAVDLDQDGIEEIIAGYSAGLFRIWKRKLVRAPRFIGLWPQTRDPSVPVIGTEIRIMADRYNRQLLISDPNPVLLYLPRKVRSVEVLVTWPDGNENRYRTPITNRIYTLTRMVQEP
ncbi:hypothetical protein ACFL45_11725, partial [Candidatus Neomarinimicrobiota bacterium]